MYAAPKHPFDKNNLKLPILKRQETQLKIPNTKIQDFAAASFSIQKLSISADL